LKVLRPSWNHGGGQVSFGPDGFLYIGLDDGGASNDPHNNCKNTALLLAKMLRIDVNSRSVSVGVRPGRQKERAGVRDSKGQRSSASREGVAVPTGQSWKPILFPFSHKFVGS